MRQELDRRALTALAAGHLAVDFANGALPALLPFLKDRFGLSYTLAAALMLASAFFSSLIQPLFGLWSDRRGAYWLMPTGVAVAGIGIALAADVPHYWLVVLFVIVSGVGVAAYHPEGSKFAAYASGKRRASGMSFFSVGGNLGYALGPILATPLVLWQGLKGGLFLMVPCLVIALILVRARPFLQGFATEAVTRARGAGQDDLRALGLLLGVICFRSVAWFGLVTFVPLWEVSLGHSKAHGNHLLSLMLLVGGLGTIAAGPLADRVGLRPVLIGSLLACPPLILVFILVGGVAGRDRARRRRLLRDRHLRRDDGDEPAVPAEPDRDGVGPLDRVVDRARRDRRGGARRRRRLDRPARRAARLRRCAGARPRARADAAGAAAPARGARAGACGCSSSRATRRRHRWPRQHASSSRAWSRASTSRRRRA